MGARGRHARSPGGRQPAAGLRRGLGLGAGCRRAARCAPPRRAPRHACARCLRRAEDIPALTALQLAILRAAAGMLTPGGRLLYSTCSVLPEENEEVIARLLAAEPQLALARMPAGGELAPGAVDRRAGAQLLPGAEAGTDGFYYA